MVKARKYVVKKYHQGLPKKDDLEIVEYELPPLKDGEILSKTEWISVDPSHRASNNMMYFTVPYDQFGYQVGRVVESKDPNYPIGTRIVTFEGWCDYVIVKEDAPKRQKLYMDKIYKLPDLKGLPNSLGVGAVGMPGVCAYFGFLKICKPKAGETVVVTGAAGAIGSLVGQIAKIKGCKVIGFTGSDEKAKYLETELGFDRAFNYKTVNVSKALKEAAPEGVDCYFDNVGGELSSEIMSGMKTNGRVSVCGSISSYNETASDYYATLPKATIVQPFVLVHQLRVEGFHYHRWSLSHWAEAFEELTNWIKSGQLKAPETITEGFDNLFEAYIGMLAGENLGKAVVKV